MSKFDLHKFLDGYGQNLENYIKKYYPGFKKLCVSKASTYNECFDALLQLYFFSSQQLDDFGDKSKRKIKKRYYESFYALFCKSCQCIWSIKMCLESGCLSDASSLLRTLFETYISLKLLSLKNPFRRARLYWNYGYVTEYQNMINNEGLVKSGKISKDEFDRQFSRSIIKNIKKNYNRIKKDYGNPKYTKWYYSLYGDKSFKQICENKDIDESINYVKLYGAFSITVHSNKKIENLLIQNNAYNLAPNYTGLIIPMTFLALSFHINNLSILLEFCKIKNRKDIMLFLNFFLAGLDQNIKKKESYKYFSRFIKSIIKNMKTSKFHSFTSYPPTSSQ